MKTLKFHLLYLPLLFVSVLVGLFFHCLPSIFFLSGDYITQFASLQDRAIAETRMQLHHIQGQHYEDKRCRCVCPSLAAVLNNTQNSDRRLFIANVPPSQCNCDGVILPVIAAEVKERGQEFCPRCECKYESRNTTVIMVVVVMVIWIIALLVVYMGFIKCLHPFINRKKAKFYREGTPEEAQTLLMHNATRED